MGLYNLRELKLTGTKMRRDAEAENRMTSYLRYVGQPSDKPAS